MIRLDLEDRIGFLTLARPEKRNAMTPEMLDEFAGAVESLPVAARCLVLRGDADAVLNPEDEAASRWSSVARFFSGL